jgi:hypothetical protein
MGSAPRPTDCNDPIAAYTTTFEIPYGNRSPPHCEPPTDAEEGKALNEAKDKFKSVAAEYCALGECPVSTQQCLARVAILAVENLGVGAKGQGEFGTCILRFRVTGSITCQCRKKVT